MDNQFQNGFPQNQQNNTGYPPTTSQQIPQQNTYNPQQNSYIPQQNTYNPQQNTYNPQQNAYIPQQNTYSPQQNTNVPPGQPYTYSPMEQPQKPKSKKGLIIAIIALVLVAAIVLIAVFGHSSPEKQFYGNWTVKVDYTDKIKGLFDEDDDVEFSSNYKFELQYDFEFKENNTYSVNLNEESFDKAKKKFIEEMKNLIYDLLKEEYPEYSSYSKSEMDEIIEELFGYTVDDLLNELISDFNYENFSEGSNKKGNFEIEDDKLYLSDSLSKDVDKSKGLKFEIKSDDEIVIKDYLIEFEDEEIVEDESLEDFECAFDLTLVKN